MSVGTAFELYIDDLVNADEAPAIALWALQYISPGLNGNLPASDSATAWSHQHAGHQTLFSHAWSQTQDDGATNLVNIIIDHLTHAQQAA